MLSTQLWENLDSVTLLLAPNRQCGFLTRWYEYNVHMVEDTLGTLTWSLVRTLLSGNAEPLQLPASHVILRAKDDTALLNADVHWHSNRWQFFLVCNEGMYMQPHVCLCAQMPITVTSSYVPLLLSTLISDTSFSLNLEFVVSVTLLPVPTVS